MKQSKCKYCGNKPSNYGYDCNRMYAYNCCDDPECIVKWKKEYLSNQGGPNYKKRRII